MKTLLIITTIWITCLACYYAPAYAEIAILGDQTIESYDLTAKSPRNAVSSVTDGKEMTIKEHIWRLLTEEGGLTFDEAITGMTMIESCENKSWNPEAIGVNENGSVDFGIWQLNSYWVLEKRNVSLACAIDVYCSTREAIKIFRERDNTWTAWNCYK